MLNGIIPVLGKPTTGGSPRDTLTPQPGSWPSLPQGVIQRTVSHRMPVQFLGKGYLCLNGFSVGENILGKHKDILLSHTEL